MKVCAATHCILPAKWKPHAIARPAMHWREMPDRNLTVPLCFCELHKSEATLEKLFTDEARRNLDIQFCKFKWPQIDWGRTTLEWIERSPRDGQRLEFPQDEGGPGMTRDCGSGPGGAPA